MNTVMITRVDETQWQARAGELIVGHGDVSARPDGRHFVSIDVWDDAAFDPLAGAMLAALPTPLHTLVAGDDPELASRWEQAGFAPERREWEYVLATGAAPAAPAGVTVLPAGTAEERELRRLDQAVRAEVEADRGWHTMPAEVRPGPPGDTLIDPSLYAVAVHGGEYAGLIRVVRSRKGTARIGLLAVREAHRRQGLGRALLAHALGDLHRTGVTTAWAEIDETNTAATALFEHFGAERSDHVLHLVRR
ncbi:GNAT family N-acetyltransferase [Streptomyces sp. TLI_171]|uniref:GNAT family N-acetyltransferase n=1 Tax=Streptomyces sp. TLI_171 TaxID=1938859 RepID=UPI000C183860|nr:GNAT family N-acetyltransferase [Streptomyces sp. TLI_171]RKE23141.1 acetyltransferase (GNAT) family protein [Streptomyces sp. TLI_171]